MKTTNRAGRKAGKNSTSAQSAIAPKSSSGETPKCEVFLRIFSDDGDSVSTVINEFKLPSDLVNYVRASAFLENVNFENFIVEALRGQIKRGELGFSIPALEDTVQRALLSLEAMDNKLLLAAGESTNPRNPDFDPQLSTTACAYHAMALQVAIDLHNQFQQVCAFVQAGRASAAEWAAR